ncbi:GDSL-type esterase/lipase family protein [Rhodoplanes sp. TEM]|uniref:GDSL-type esterase/lipase family protein n=1 Tax=Rhodoplanes tepidamans TaxID=200616 RepID=A0ABT5J6R8_RHOTP|nr:MULTISPECIES: GDSL-type esterase/lipase family protein [Rhodoplanes]MDC7785356.1 GDSL-type esterase/lipase family protein [Rhodoplanes tepidamans]MDC7984314.1 GDSL-type esterase/lipase family protein [Rhodoplanes sp. TEM]MDQ0353192.1 lysophospholipase L1-like esterase [Rhodoplanes tepidamans]
MPRRAGLIASLLVAALALVTLLPPDPAAAAPKKSHWVASWVGSVQGPYPVGNPSAQPDQRYAFPSEAAGARDQTLRMVVRPDIWGREARLRFSNAFGTKPLTLDGVHAGLQLGGPALVKGSNRPVTFGRKASVTIPPGESVWSDPVRLAFVKRPDDRLLAGRKLAVSFHVVGESGPMTWHAKALQTSYVSPPGSGARGHEEGEAAFPYGTSSWFFLDAVEMRAPAGAFAVVAFGDSITDGTASTMNGDDRWPDVLSRRLKAVHGNRVAVVNAGIGGNQIAGPAEYGPHKPFPGGPSARSRIDRDVLALSGVRALIWLEGTNDFSRNGNASLETVRSAMDEVLARLRRERPDIKLIGATVVSALGSSSPAHGFVEQDEKRRDLNDHIRRPGVFDAVVDFDAATLDPTSGGLKEEFVPDSTTGGKGDRLHPNRSGYHAMGHAIDLGLFGPAKGRRAAAK